MPRKGGLNGEDVECVETYLRTNVETRFSLLGGKQCCYPDENILVQLLQG